MTRCPHCFTPVPPAAAPVPAPGPRGARTRFAPEPAPAVGEPPADCPRCGRPYPAGWIGTSTTCIVMAGARTTGKSIYLAVMIKQLEQLAAQVGMDVSPATPEVARIFHEHYVKPLYVERGMMAATPPSGVKDAYQRESLVFVLTTRADVRHHLVIRDVAGEDLEHADQLTDDQLEFFAAADNVFFLFDPLKIDDIRLLLRRLVPEQRLGGDPKQVLNATLALVERGSPRLAVIMSKFDALQALRAVQGGGEWAQIMRNPGAAFFRDPGIFGAPDDVDGMLLHEEVRSLLIRLDQGALVSRIENAGRRSGYRFFAVSALGDPPNGTVLNTRGIAPFRCLDPLRWALAGTGVLP
jgi:hypothetical protein